MGGILLPWDIVVKNWSFLAAGLWATIEIFVVSMIAGTVLGVLMGVLRTSRVFLIQITTRAFIEVFRGLPTLITMFFVYFAVPMLFQIEIPSFLAAVIGLTLWELSEIAEIMRGAIQSIPKGQVEAGRAMALNKAQVLIYILMPQAVRRMLPPLIGVYTRLVKGTALASLVGVNDLVMAGKIVVERTLEPLEVYVFIMAVFFIINYPLSVLSRKLERKLI
ncbi:MAG: amino acid ABC transporter permease [Firmicutes bacterium HGW-Firmicutes-14]|nr:MAG: amino acid ABC transporter permease [Firmicutes bacterium HGW-Firmicutes-14]